MRNQKKGRILSRKSGPRRALLNNLAEQLIVKGRIKTTEAKAKELSRFVEKNITKGKKDDINTRRLLARYFTPNTVKKIVEEIGPKYKERNGGYTRIIKMPPRRGDGSKVSFIELI